MAPRTIPGSPDLGRAIRERRTSLNLTIDEAAKRGGVGSKSWGHYETGASIREDKARSICRALGWQRLPSEGTDEMERSVVDESHKAWSVELAEQFGPVCARVFASGSDILLDEITEDLESLASMPPGSHLGQLSFSWLDGSLPAQFVPRYDYELVYGLQAAVSALRARFAEGVLVAETVLEEIALYLVFQKADIQKDLEMEDFGEDDDWREWLGSILGDLDVEWLLYDSGWDLTDRIAYHFDHWREAQFWSSEHELTAAERAASLTGLLVDGRQAGLPETGSAHHDISLTQQRSK